MFGVAMGFVSGIAGMSSFSILHGRLALPGAVAGNALVALGTGAVLGSVLGATVGRGQS